MVKGLKGQGKKLLVVSKKIIVEQVTVLEICYLFLRSNKE